MRRNVVSVFVNGIIRRSSSTILLYFFCWFFSTRIFSSVPIWLSVGGGELGKKKHTQLTNFLYGRMYLSCESHVALLSVDLWIPRFFCLFVPLDVWNAPIYSPNINTLLQLFRFHTLGFYFGICSIFFFFVVVAICVRCAMDWRISCCVSFSHSTRLTNYAVIQM